MFERNKEMILELVSFCQEHQENTHVITVFDDPYNTEALSGMIFPKEISDVEAGFSYASTYYTGYNCFWKFKKDVEDGKFSNPNMKYLVYSTSQLGTDVDRRSHVPILCKENRLTLLTCDAYRLGLLMDKSHYFSLLKDFSHIPHTITYYGQRNFKNTLEQKDIDDISKGKYIQTEETDNLFHNVFFQLRKLQTALEENENTRAVWISNISHL